MFGFGVAFSEALRISLKARSALNHIRQTTTYILLVPIPLPLSPSHTKRLPGAVHRLGRRAPHKENQPGILTCRGMPPACYLVLTWHAIFLFLFKFADLAEI